jgi:hypothetical protein
MYTTQEDIVSATTALKMRCRFVGLQGSEYTAAIDINEEDGGEYPITADGEYTVTLSPLTQGEHRLAVILLHGPHYMVRTRHQVTFQSSSNPQPQQISPPSPPPPPQPPPAPVPEQVPTMSITGPSQCQKLPQDDVTTILTTSEFGSRPEPSECHADARNKRLPPALAFGEQSVGFAQMPKGLHLLVLRADWTSAGGESKSLRSAPLWFGLDVDFSVEAVEHTAQRHMETGGDVLAQAQLWRCMVQHTHQLFPKVWIALSAARAYQEALGYMCTHTHTHKHTHIHTHTHTHIHT